MMSARLATLDLLEVKAFWNKGYNVKIFVIVVIEQNEHVTQITL